MQFTDHSLPVHQFMTVPWDFNPVPYCQPSSPTPMEYALPPSLEWHVWPGRRSIYNTSRQVQLPRKQCLINRERHRHATSKGMDGYDRLSVIWKSDQTDKIKRSFFQAVVVSILLYGCTTWALTKSWGEKALWHLHKNASSNIEQILEAAPDKAAAVRNLLPITKTLHVRRTKHADNAGEIRTNS